MPMPDRTFTYEIKTDRGTFDMTLDRPPRDAEEMRALAEEAAAQLPQHSADLQPQSPGILQSAGRALLNVASFPVKAATQLGSELASIPGRLGQVTELRPSDLRPSVLGPAMAQTAKDVWNPTAQALPEMVGGTLGGIAGGPPGAVAGATTARGLTSMAEGKPAPAVTEDVLTTLGVSGLTAGAPAAVRYAAKAPGRYASLPSERHAAGAAIMEKIPERFGVTDDVVGQKYASADHLSTLAKKVESEVRVSQQAGGPIQEHLRQFRQAQADVQQLAGQVKVLQDAGQPVPKQLLSALEEARGRANPKNSSVVKWLTTSPLEKFRGTTRAMARELRENPIPELQDTTVMETLKNIADQADGLAKQGGATATGLDRIIKSVNNKIGDTQGATQGMWKKVLGALHEDLRIAAERTGNPAFEAYADAIHSARLNFLRQDIEKAIHSSGIVPQRTGQSVITNPGNIQKWMQTHPEWREAVEKAQPGLLESIAADMQEIIPITDVTGRSIPGQQFGSGRLAMGAAAGHILTRLFGWNLGGAEAIGALLTGATPQMGVRMSPAYIRRSFAPVNRKGSVPATVGGAVAAAAQKGNDQ